MHPPRGQDSVAAAPLLSLVMIVRDEEEMLPAALESARNWTDELVVVDTGSQDRTVEIASLMAARVTYFPWNGSFSDARNESIRQARGQWVAILDADERFIGEAPERIREHLKPGRSFPYQALMVKVVNRDLDGTTTHSFFSPRIFPRHENIGYDGRIHNNFGAIQDKEAEFEFIQCHGLEIEHLGYDPTVYQKKNKLERNLALLERAVREEPETPRYRFYLGREYLQGQKIKEGLTLLRALFSEGPGEEPFLYIETGTQLLDTLDQIQSDPMERLEIATQLIELEPAEIDTWFFLGRVFDQLGEMGDAEAALRKVVDLIDAAEGGQLQVCRALHQQSWLYQRLAQFAEMRGASEVALLDQQRRLLHLDHADSDRIMILKALALKAPSRLERAQLREALAVLLSEGNMHDLLRTALPLIDEAHPRLMRTWRRKNQGVYPWLRV